MVLRIAVQSKGRLFEDTMALLAEAGIKVSSSKRTLLVQSSNFPIEVLYLRDDDIPQSVASGDGLKWFDGKKIATSYPAILRRFMQEKHIAADIHVITGSVEISPGIGLADAIFDIVSSGSTLVSNNLIEVETVMQSEALLIANKDLDEAKRKVLDELLFRIEAVKAAEDKKYVLMNVPTARLNDIVAVLPGVKSPTVMPLATEGWSSVHTVIEEKRFWEIIRELKSLGAEGILVVPIEKMIP